MGIERNIDVATLDLPHRIALEEVIGHKLGSHQRLTICIHEDGSSASEKRKTQTLEEWGDVYQGLTDGELTAVDIAIRTRANVTRDAL